METAELTGLQERIHRQYDRDGALEVLLGVGLAWSGALLADVGSPVYMGLVPILLALSGRAWKKRITYPRLGYAEIQRLRRAQRMRGVLLIAVTVCFILALSLIGLAAIRASGSGREFADLPYAHALLGLPIALMVAGAAVVRHAPHVWAFAALIPVLFVAAEGRGFDYSLALVLPGLLLIVVGLVRLWRFLKDNPKLEAPETL